ncbi:hypothetical protein [Candidatus Palauibacter sp.]|uniref:hypothetical protein n=1 Tax=Candidatus Palauibacter sp. TaxID=3101350 RepID=UPI003AF20304
MPRILDIDGFEWEVKALPDTARHPGADPWHYAKIRFEPRDHDEYPPREAWLKLESDVPARDVLDQYNDDYLTEAFMVAEEVGETEA